MATSDEILVATSPEILQERAAHVGHGSTLGCEEGDSARGAGTGTGRVRRTVASLTNSAGGRGAKATVPVDIRIAVVGVGQHNPEFDDDGRGMVAMFGAADIDWPEFRSVELS